ncbi:MAG TPA: N-6 DNA methylase [Thermoleophilaceae bacterium]|nr:N-6 DNA methylase [Thermoleophilaceae bacterium]
MAPALDALYRVGGEFVDYGDLSARHLGTIYERLLDYRLEERDGALGLASTSGRRETGSYFTPERVVDRIVERTLAPLLDARSEHVAALGLRGEDALEVFLGLRVLDPAMGSGHFLVAAAAWIATHIATDPSYDGDLPRAEIQRRVAERCLYGVDLNPMAVELAQLSIWLTTVRRGEPLTFLTNLRVGNALVGVELDELLAGEETLFAQQLAQVADAILSRIEAIASRGSERPEEVHRKEELALAVEGLREPLERHADHAVSPAFPGERVSPFHWGLEFPEVFLSVAGMPRDDGGFDAVIGNPPYVRIQVLGRRLADWCRRRYRTASGSFDTYIPFLERGVELLAPQGRLGFIVPNKLTKLDYGRRLRDWLARDGLVEEIVDFGDAQLFAGATNYTCILVLSRRPSAELVYRRVGRGEPALREALAGLDAVQAERFPLRELGGDPWVLATGDEACLLRSLRGGAEPLGEVTEQIFQGLITSADPIYILEDRGARGPHRRVYSRASEREVELESELLHPLASGSDVDRYAFGRLGSVLLFPYRREGEAMRLLNPEEISSLPLTAAYLREHEEALRGRERGKMDHDGWYGYVYPKSLGVHDRPKLGVAATVRRLEVAADPEGAVYFHNVRVNGVLVDFEGPSIWTLLTLLNSRVLDWFFRRGAVDHAHGYYAANKQFIAPLPIRRPSGQEGDRYEALGRRLHALSKHTVTERAGFLDWLDDALGTHVRRLPGATALGRHEDLELPQLLAILRRSSTRFSRDPDTRAFRDRLAEEHLRSSDRLLEHRSSLVAAESEADQAVADLYELSTAERALVDRDYE